MKKKWKFSILVITLAVIAITCMSAIQIRADELIDIKNIKLYYNYVNEKNIKSILDILDGEYEEVARNIYADKENVSNHIGIFNISKAEILSIEEVSSFEGLELLEFSDYNDEIIRVYKVSVKIDKYQDDNDEFFDGINEIFFILNSRNKIIGCRMLNDIPVIKRKDEISLFGYDTPITKPSANPDLIWVYRTKGPNKGKAEYVPFKEYCKVVTTCEVGYENWDKAALRACALAIKDYGIARLYGRKYVGVGFNIRDDEEDQVYDPDKKRIKVCDNAVNFIWKYYVVDANSKLFPTFFVRRTTNATKIEQHAKKNKGVLSQEQAQKLAADNNYSWKKILKYFYSRKSGVSYYNSEVAVGNVSIVE